MSRMHHDIAIIGLGPAGATLARMLSPSFAVLALDRKTESDSRTFSKPCGGLLAPDAQKALAASGLTLPLDVLVDPQIFAVRAIDLTSRKIRHYQRFYLNMDRLSFDRWLISLIPQNVEIRLKAKCQSITRHNGKFKLTWSQNGVMAEATADLLVGADGAGSMVRRFLYPNLRIGYYLAIQQWFADQRREALYASLFDPEITSCYCWGLTKDNSFILGGAFEPRNAMAKMRLLKTRMETIGPPLGKPLKTEACKVLRPRSLSDFKSGQANAFLIGEAAGLISPSSLEGISYALHSAKCLAKVLNDPSQNANRRYHFSLAGTRLKLLLKTGKAAAIYTPFSRRLIMASGLASLKVAD